MDLFNKNITLHYDEEEQCCVIHCDGYVVTGETTEEAFKELEIILDWAKIWENI